MQCLYLSNCQTTCSFSICSALPVNVFLLKDLEKYVVFFKIHTLSNTFRCEN